MYNSINSAVIKSILHQMKFIDLVKEIEFMRSQIQVLEDGNKKNMFLRLYHFANERKDELKQNYRPFKTSSNV